MTCVEEDRTLPSWPAEALEAMEKALTAAGAEAMRLQRTAVRQTKGEAYDLVTEGDIAAQRIAMIELAKAFPGVPFVAEESAESGAVPTGISLVSVAADGKLLDGSNSFITLDPIDGTSNYACGGPDWSVAACLVRDGQPKLACIVLPRRGQTVTAAAGLGCRINGEPVKALPKRGLKRSLVAAELGGFIGKEWLQRVIGLVDHCLGIRNVFSTTGNTLDFLNGITGAFLHLCGGWIWDFAPTALAAQEAGAIVCDSHGNQISWDTVHGTVQPIGVIFADTAETKENLLSVLLSDTAASELESASKRPRRE